MKRVRFLLVLLALSAAVSACSDDIAGPRTEECPVMGSGSGTCS